MKDDCVARHVTLSALLDGRLTPAESAECAEHLESCERCRAAYERLSAARDLLRGLPPPEAPADLLPAILAGVERELADERATVEMLHSLPAPRPPRDLLPAIVSAAETELRRERVAQVFWGRWRVATVAIAAAAAVLLAVFVPRSFAPPPDGHQALPIVAPGPEVAVLPAEEPPAVVSAEATEPKPAAASVRRVARRTSSAVTEPAPAASTTVPPAPIAPVEPVLAMAPIAPSAEVLSAATPIGPAEPSGRAALALAPRNTVADTEVGSPAMAPASGLESDLAAGIVARMMVDKFVSEHLIESAPTLLAVVTDVPSSQLGPALAAEGDDAGFGLRFTESMRQALTASENQIR